jgi:hypothetical protein
MTTQPVNTKLLAPVCAVYLTWALTGSSAPEPESKDIAARARKRIGDIESDAAESDTQERNYVRSALSTMVGSERSLDIVYKARKLNFDENQQLRTAQLNSYQENLEFGKKTKDFIQSIPSMTISSAVGTITISELWNELPGWALAAIAVGLAALGHIVNAVYTRIAAKWKLDNYVKQDFDRGTYYDQYVARARSILVSLYDDVERTHKGFFGQAYDASTDSFDIVDGLLKGVKNTRCLHVDRCMKEGKVKPDHWAVCEAGGKAAEDCKLYTGKKPTH